MIPAFQVDYYCRSSSPATGVRLPVMELFFSFYMQPIFPTAAGATEAVHMRIRARKMQTSPPRNGHITPPGVEHLGSALLAT